MIIKAGMSFRSATAKGVAQSLPFKLCGSALKKRAAEFPRAGKLCATRFRDSLLTIHHLLKHRQTSKECRDACHPLAWTDAFIEAGKRVDDLQPFKSGEVPVSGNEFRDAMLEAESDNVRVMNEIACGPRLANGSIKHAKVPPRLSEQNERGRSQHPFEIGQDNLERDRRMKDARVSDDPEEFVNAGPRDGPGESSFDERSQDLEGRVMVLARLNLSVDQDVGVNRLHGLGSVHKIEERISVQQVDSGKLSSLPAPKAQSVRFPRARYQRTTKKVIDDCLESSALLGGFSLQFKEVRPVLSGGIAPRLVFQTKPQCVRKQRGR